jgi:hypothetical protein
MMLADISWISGNANRHGALQIRRITKHFIHHDGQVRKLAVKKALQQRVVGEQIGFQSHDALGGAIRIAIQLCASIIPAAAVPELSRCSEPTASASGRACADRNARGCHR